MKKIFFVFVMAVVMSLGLVGCGSETIKDSSNESPTFIELNKVLDIALGQ